MLLSLCFSQSCRPVLQTSSDEVSRGLLCELPPLNCENEAKVGSDKVASPHLVNFIPGQRRALERLR